ncbi:hypothetical protein BJ944DRAFT_272982 [Cunninghamella echinulata]|nr:hypothetical protein BJ944DRAFT_272982 [Cunninghamella echinulata]
MFLYCPQNSYPSIRFDSFIHLFIHPSISFSISLFRSKNPSIYHVIICFVMIVLIL